MVKEGGVGGQGEKRGRGEAGEVTEIAIYVFIC